MNIDGEIIGHTINPKLGKPIQTNVLSVTVLAEFCINADGWATALMTMDYEAGKEIVRSEKNLDVIWIIERSDTSRRLGMTNGVKIKDSIYEFIQ